MADYGDRVVDQGIAGLPMLHSPLSPPRTPYLLDLFGREEEFEEGFNEWASNQLVAPSLVENTSAQKKASLYVI